MQQQQHRQFAIEQQRQNMENKHRDGEGDVEVVLQASNIVQSKEYQENLEEYFETDSSLKKSGKESKHTRERRKNAHDFVYAPILDGSVSFVKHQSKFLQAQVKDKPFKMTPSFVAICYAKFRQSIHQNRMQPHPEETKKFEEYVKLQLEKLKGESKKAVVLDHPPVEYLLDL